MGEELRDAVFDSADRRTFRAKAAAGLKVLREMLAGRPFGGTEPAIGIEIECNLVDDTWAPAMRNTDVLDAIADPAYQTELGAYNIELNVPPRRLAGGCLAELEKEVRASLDAAEAGAARHGSHIVMIGILPTLTRAHLLGDWMSTSSLRYRALNDSIFAARGEDIVIDMGGDAGDPGGSGATEHLTFTTPSISPESACTSVQLHLQVHPDDFARYWNAAQLVAAPQLALGANSPFFVGRHPAAETRIDLFAQATDTRTDELRAQGVRPRVWFGERWIDSPLDLFEENARFFPPLLPESSDEDAAAVLAAGGVPTLAELRMHNGTVYRWNRPVYDVTRGPDGSDTPHLRVENRVLPAGPTVLDMLANAALFYGLTRALAELDVPPWSHTDFGVARENLRRAARDGITARLHWPGRGEVDATTLTREVLLPLAHDGLRAWGVDDAVCDRYLGVLEGRAVTGRNGATWQVATVAAAQARGLDRESALRQMLAAYSTRMHSNEPVHTWEVPA